MRSGDPGQSLMLRRGLVFIGKVFSGLDGPLKALRQSPPQAPPSPQLNSIRWSSSVADQEFYCKRQCPVTRAGERIVVGEVGVPLVKRVKRVSAAGFNVAQHRVGQLQSQQCLGVQAVVGPGVQVPGQDHVAEVSVLAGVVERQGRIVSLSIARRVLVIGGEVQLVHLDERGTQPSSQVWRNPADRIRRWPLDNR